MENMFNWIIFILMLAIILFILVKYLKNALLYYSKMDTSSVVSKTVKIPVGDIELNGKLILPKYAIDENDQLITNLPLIVLGHGWGMSLSGMSASLLMEYAIPLAIGGPYVILLYEARGHGKTPGERKLDEKIFDDIPKVFDFAEKLEGIDSDRLGFIGISFGGEIALTKAYSDERIKATISIVSPHDAKANFTRKPESFKAKLAIKFLRASGVKGEKISNESNKLISPAYIIDRNNKDLNSRVFLINARNDHLIHFSEFEKNREYLKLADDQVLILEKGGHTMRHQELLVIASALRFFKVKL